MKEGTLLPRVREQTLDSFIAEYNRDIEYYRVILNRMKTENPVIRNHIDQETAILGRQREEDGVFYKNAMLVTYELLRLEGESAGQKLPVVSQQTADTFFGCNYAKLGNWLIKTIEQENQLILAAFEEPGDNHLKSLLLSGVAGVYGLLRKQANTDLDGKK
jgi:hypothetical protein